MRDPILPWTPKAGEDNSEEIARRLAEREAVARRWEAWQSLRRYLLVMLLAFLGGMFGSLTTIVILHH